MVLGLSLLFGKEAVMSRSDSFRVVGFIGESRVLIEWDSGLQEIVRYADGVIYFD